MTPEFLAELEQAYVDMLAMMQAGVGVIFAVGLVMVGLVFMLSLLERR